MGDNRTRNAILYYSQSPGMPALLGLTDLRTKYLTSNISFQFQLNQEMHALWGNMG